MKNYTCNYLIPVTKEAQQQLKKKECYICYMNRLLAIGKFIVISFHKSVNKLPRN